MGMNQPNLGVTPPATIAACLRRANGLDDEPDPLI